LSTTEASLTVHLVMPEKPPDDGFLERLCGDLCSRFAIGHATVQIEQGRIACAQAQPGSV
jgi:cobalt-zinc-cadmium efflux system protein